MRTLNKYPPATYYICTYKTNTNIISRSIHLVAYTLTKIKDINIFYILGTAGTGFEIQEF